MKRAGWILTLFFFATFCRAADRTTFWTVGSSGEVRQWKLNGDSTISGGENCAVADHEFMCSGLAWCEALSPEPQFHFLYNDLSHNKASAGSIGKKSTTAHIPKGTQSVSNMGGCGKFLYVQETDGHGPDQPASLLRCKGDRFETVATLADDEAFAAADIAVDSLGRAWVLVGTKDYNDSTHLQMRCYTPEGKQLSAIPVKGISRMNAYGLMLIDGTFYVGYGASNERFPDKLVALAYKNHQLVPAFAIAFIPGGHDLASFYPGCPELPTGAMDSSNQKN